MGFTCSSNTFRGTAQARGFASHWLSNQVPLWFTYERLCYPGPAKIQTLWCLRTRISHYFYLAWVKWTEEFIYSFAGSISLISSAVIQPLATHISAGYSRCSMIPLVQLRERICEKLMCCVNYFSLRLTLHCTSAFITHIHFFLLFISKTWFYLSFLKIFNSLCMESLLKNVCALMNLSLFPL